MRLDDLKEEAVERIYHQLLSELLKDDNLHTEDKRFLLEHLIFGLDEGDADDQFGSEGWKHRYGLED